jgi:hypothetical protein
MDRRLVQELWDENPGAIRAVVPDDAVLCWNRAAAGNYRGVVAADAEQAQQLLTTLVSDLIPARSHTK